MTYRDDQEGLRARVATLERDLDAARAEIGRLTGRPAVPAPGDVVETSRLLGSTSRLVLDRHLDHEIDEDGLDELARLLRARFGAVHQSRRTLQAGGLTVDVRDGGTRVRADANLGGFALGAISLTGLGGGIAALLLFSIAATVIRGLPEVHFLWMAPLTMLALWPVARWLHRMMAAASEARVRASFEVVVAAASALGTSARQRIAPVGEGVDALAETEGIAEAEGAGAAPVIGRRA